VRCGICRADVLAKGWSGPGPAAKGVAMAKTSPGEFVRQVRQETAKVIWPTRPEVVRTTILVLIMTSLLALFFLLIDQVLGRGVRLLLGLGD